jgi:pSer/pThr/pTyr-binding forkhead associated (FHA) protein
VSARHATLRREPVGVVLEDEGSLNGTFVNGQLIQQHLLEDGDQIQVGPHLLVFVPPAGGAPTAP